MIKEKYISPTICYRKVVCLHYLESSGEGTGDDTEGIENEAKGMGTGSDGFGESAFSPDSWE